MYMATRGQVDFLALIQNNIAAVLGLCGVVVGSVLTAIISFALQGQQRKWALDDNRREWRRQYREKQLNAVVDWVNQWLRLARLVRDMEQAVVDVKHSARANISKEQLAKYKVEVNDQQRSLTLQNATIRPVVGSLGDKRLSQLFDDFQRLGSDYSDIFRSTNLEAGAVANQALFSQAVEVATDIHKRAEQLIEEVWSDSHKKG